MLVLIHCYITSTEQQSSFFLSLAQATALIPHPPLFPYTQTNAAITTDTYRLLNRDVRLFPANVTPVTFQLLPRNARVSNLLKRTLVLKWHQGRTGSAPGNCATFWILDSKDVAHFSRSLFKLKQICWPYYILCTKDQIFHESLSFPLKHVFRHHWWIWSIMFFVLFFLNTNLESEIHINI